MADDEKREKERFSHHPSLIRKKKKEYSRKEKEETFETKKNPRNVILFIVDSNVSPTSLKLSSIRVTLSRVNKHRAKKIQIF